ncbi:hypothetical protein E4T56_gene18970 [Termitomyces sp. T112]|nr:hypothetical protein E4T56_gene18970 [Termitomyces sp. T112]
MTTWKNRVPGSMVVRASSSSQTRFYGSTSLKLGIAASEYVLTKIGQTQKNRIPGSMTVRESSSSQTWNSGFPGSMAAGASNLE